MIVVPEAELGDAVVEIVAFLAVRTVRNLREVVAERRERRAEVELRPEDRVPFEVPRPGAAVLLGHRPAIARRRTTALRQQLAAVLDVVAEAVVGRELVAQFVGAVLQAGELPEVAGVFDREARHRDGAVLPPQRGVVPELVAHDRAANIAVQVVILQRACALAHTQRREVIVDVCALQVLVLVVAVDRALDLVAA